MSSLHPRSVSFPRRASGPSKHSLALASTPYPARSAIEARAHIHFVPLSTIADVPGFDTDKRITPEPSGGIGENGESPIPWPTPPNANPSPTGTATPIRVRVPVATLTLTLDAETPKVRATKTASRCPTSRTAVRAWSSTSNSDDNASLKPASLTSSIGASLDR